ncbi:hypothetical protein [Aquicoccus sp. SU-CL01552]|uniref:GspE/PulE/PilB domain-containing protein n=1 Tax=Aquicoccus sp. SU-CL01552 TaxID=3127656 RepID=UPI00333E4543
MQQLRSGGSVTSLGATQVARPLGRILVEMGAITPRRLVAALHLQSRFDARIGDILVAEGWTSRHSVLAALARQTDLPLIDLDHAHPDATLIAQMPARFWAVHGVIPWKRAEGRTRIVTDDPAGFARLRSVLSAVFGPVQPVLADPEQIRHTLARACRTELAEGASTRVPAHLSCRGWTPASRAVIALASAIGIILLTLAPMASLSLASAAAMITLALFMSLRLTGALAHLLGRGLPATSPPPSPFRATAAAVGPPAAAPAHCLGHGPALSRERDRGRAGTAVVALDLPQGAARGAAGAGRA